MTVTHYLAQSRKHGYRSAAWLFVAFLAIASVVVFAVHDGLWPPRSTSPTTSMEHPG